MATHRAVAFIVQKEDIEVGITRRSYDCAIHIGVSAWLPHRPLTNVIIMVAKITALFENS